MLFSFCTSGKYLFYSFCLVVLSTGCASLKNNKTLPSVRLINVDSGYAANSINTTIFRKNSLVSYQDTQYIAFYNGKGYMVIGKRRLGREQWQLKQTIFKGNVTDAHNVISLMTDGDGYLHLAWDHHNNRLHYVRSLSPGSLEFGEPQSMTGKQEGSVSYPEFYCLPNGDLIFMYRDGSSGKGNLVINRYTLLTKQWNQLQPDLIDGEGKRNAYWQSCIDANGIIHLSWVWRESPDVASNHDLCYARSSDGGITWMRSNGQKYQLPITASSAQIIAHIPQRSELINQTSMCVGANKTVYVASYWKDSGYTIPQYHIAWLKDGRWETQSLAFRQTSFSLSGMGTKRIPISRPQLITWEQDGNNKVALIFRDEERGNKASMALCSDVNRKQWQLFDFIFQDLGSWEPTYDTELWKSRKELHLFIQKTEQADGEGKSKLAPTMVQVLEWHSTD